MRVIDLKKFITKHNIPDDTVYYIMHGEKQRIQCIVDHWELNANGDVVCKVEIEKTECHIGDFLEFIHANNVPDESVLYIDTPTNTITQYLSNVKYDKNTGRLETAAY